MAAPAKVYRAGIIGCGRVADTIQGEILEAPYWMTLPYSHADAYETCHRTELAAGAEPNPTRLADFGQHRGVDRLYTDYREMLAREQLDIVSICVPTRAHTEVALEVVKHGVKGVWLEKPIAQSMAEADQLIAAFDAAGVKVGVNHVRTYDALYGRVRDVIASGAIGDIICVMLHGREGAAFGGTHFFDLVRFLIAAEPEWVFGQLDPGLGRFDPGARGVVGFAHGIQVYVNIADTQAVGAEFDIVGNEGRIRVGNSLYPELHTIDRSQARPVLVQRPFPGVQSGRSGMLNLVYDLIAAIETGKKTLSDLRDSRRDLEIAVAFHLSHRSGERVELPVEDLDYVIHDPWGREPGA